MALQNLPSSSNLILGVIGEIFKKISGTPSKNDKSSSVGEVLLVILAVAILFVIAAAPFKILLRRNFGQNAISTVETIFGSLFFGLCSLLALSIGMSSSSSDNTSGYTLYFENIYVLSAISTIFFGIAVFTLFKGLRENAAHKFSKKGDWVTDNYRGDSILYSDKVNDQETLMKVWRSVEPSFCFKWSILLTFVHPLLGIPLLFSSTSFWINEHYHVVYKWKTIDVPNISTNTEVGLDSFGGNFAS